MLSGQIKLIGEALGSGEGLLDVIVTALGVGLDVIDGIVPGELATCGLAFTLELGLGFAGERQDAPPTTW